MKSFNDYQKATCILMGFSEYKELISELTDGLQKVIFAFNEVHGLYYEHTEKAEESDVYWNKDIKETLSEHFGVNIISVHADDERLTTIWIQYEESIK